MKPFILLATLFTLLLVQSGDASITLIQDGAKITTVFLVRHAERGTTPPQDPSLSDLGKRRSQELARILKPSGIKAIYTSQFLRTKETAGPLAKELGIEAAVIPINMSPSNPREVSQASIKEITEKVYAREGEAVLIVGHSNTVPEVIKMLGAETVPVIDEKTFDDLFIVTVQGRGRAKLTHMKYGSSE